MMSEPGKKKKAFRLDKYFQKGFNIYLTERML